MAEKAIAFSPKASAWVPPSPSWTLPSPPNGCSLAAPPSYGEHLTVTSFSLALSAKVLVCLFVCLFPPFWPFISIVGSPHHPQIPEQGRLLVHLPVPRALPCASLCARCLLRARLRRLQGRAPGYPHHAAAPEKTRSGSLER